MRTPSSLAIRWGIAERFYKTGYEFPRLVAANLGREMPDGQRFTQAGVIHPGWVLLVPKPSSVVEEVEGKTYYVVNQGDTLYGIAARFLEDESRWERLFALNEGAARMGDGRVLKNPDLIWPGLRLELPLATPTSMDNSRPSDAAPELPKVAPVAAAEPAAVIAPVPASSPVIAEELPPESADGAAPPLLSGAAVLAAAAAAAGGALLLARRRVRRSLSEPPIPSVQERTLTTDDFADAEFTRSLMHRLHGGEAELAVLVAEQAVRFLDEQGIDGVSVVTARQAQHDVTLTLSTGLTHQARVQELVAEFATRLGGTGQASLTSDHDVSWKIAGLQLAALMARSTAATGAPSLLLTLGALPNRETLYASWPELGNILIAGLPGGGTDVILTSVISALAARCRPDDLRLWTIADRRVVPAQLLMLPHQGSEPVVPDDKPRVQRLLHEVRAELLRRMRDTDQVGVRPVSAPQGEPELVLVVGEIGDLSHEDDSNTLEMIGVHGPAHGVRLLAATTNAGALGDDVLTNFGTRLVLQTMDDEESIQLLGQPSAADLGSGDVLVRIDGRKPIQVQGFRITVDHLDELVGVMRREYGAPHHTRGETGIPGSAVNGTGHRARNDETTPSADGEGPLAGSGEHTAIPMVERAAEGHDNTCELEPAHRVDQPVPSMQAPGLFGGSTSVVDPIECPEQEHIRSGGLQLTLTPDPVELTEGAPAPETTGLPDASSPGDTAGIIETDAVAAAGHTSDGGDTFSGPGPLIQVTCFGEFAVSSGDLEITPFLEEGPSFKAFEVLAFLAVHPDGAVSRDKLLAAVWPDIDEKSAANRMRVAMGRLRGLLARQVPGLPSKVVRCARWRLPADSVSGFLGCVTFWMPARSRRSSLRHGRSQPLRRFSPSIAVIC
ncbi:MAG: LysM peptidoglycan-binding domain-containing protein [Chloroflexi bacterium]|nr:LysM peptidoglycan-binding domain-containing protein [Chloroflexota bacterium]